MPHAAATFQTSTIMFSISFNILGDKHKKKKIPEIALHLLLSKR